MPESGAVAKSARLRQHRNGREELPCIQGRGGQEETPRVRGWGQRLRGATPHPRPGAAGRIHLRPEARVSGRKESACARDQERQPGGATQGAVAAWHRRA